MEPPSRALLRVLAGERVDPPPIWLMRQAGRHLPEYRELRARAGGFLEFCYTPALAVEASLQPVRRYALDAAILFSDILVVPDALGCKVMFVTGEGPRLDPLDPEDRLPCYDDASFQARLAPVYETVATLAAKLPRQTSLIGFAGAPWTVATYMVEGGSSREFQLTKSWAYTASESFAGLIAVLVEATTAYLSRQIEAGVQAVQLFDSWAGVLPPTEFRRWVIAPTAEIVSRLKAAYPDVPVIGFPRGAGIGYPGYVAETGVDAVSLDATVPPAWAAAEIPGRCAIQGNLDNLALLAGGEGLDRMTADILTALKSRAHVFNLGHGVLPETPPEHVERLCALVRRGA